MEDGFGVQTRPEGLPDLSNVPDRGFPEIEPVFGFRLRLVHHTPVLNVFERIDPLEGFPPFIVEERGRTAAEFWTAGEAINLAELGSEPLGPEGWNAG